jgi:hypothetical protein
LLPWDKYRRSVSAREGLACELLQIVSFSLLADSSLELRLVYVKGKRLMGHPLIERLKQLKFQINATGFALTDAENAMEDSPNDEQESEYYLRSSDLELDLEELWKLLDKIDENAKEIREIMGLSLGDIGAFVVLEIYCFIGYENILYPLNEFYRKLFPRNRVDPREFLSNFETRYQFCFTDSSSLVNDEYGWHSEPYEIDWKDLANVECSTKDLRETLEFFGLPRDIELKKLNDFCEGKITPTSVSDFMARESS